MGIFGVGVDIAQVGRFVRILGRHRDRFLKRAFHEQERKEFIARKFATEYHACQHIAGRWAAKEAVTKAIGSRILFPEIVIQSNVNASPTISFQGEALEVARNKGISQTHLSVSHDGEYAIAYVILEKETKQ
jgi:holo-[acyl-carrier protein] synthase